MCSQYLNWLLVQSATQTCSFTMATKIEATTKRIQAQKGFVTIL